MTIPNASASVRRDLYQHVTNRILEDLECGVRPWLKQGNRVDMFGISPLGWVHTLGS